MRSRKRSDLVVISWWSNALGLACLHSLARYAPDRKVYLVQAGKPEAQRQRFREALMRSALGANVLFTAAVAFTANVEELPYPAGASGEDWRVRETVARELLGEHQGLWFFDHDLFLQEPAEPWLADMDRRFADSDCCLCHPQPSTPKPSTLGRRRGPSITNPAFWLSPARFPAGMPSFARVPYRPDPVASRPYDPPPAPSAGAAPILPAKDTLVAVMEFLQERGQVCGFPTNEADRVPGGPAPFPRAEHIGGLYTFALLPALMEGDPPPDLVAWLGRCAAQFQAFYDTCPPEWLAIEDPVLLRRIQAAGEVGG